MGAARHPRRARRAHGARPRLRGLALRSVLGRPARDPRPARARRRPRVGSRDPSLDGRSRRAPRRPRGSRHLALPDLAALGGDRPRECRLRDAPLARGAPPGRPPRRDRAVVLHERFHVPDRDRRRPRPRRRQPLRPRLRRLGARAVLPGGRRRGGRVRPSGPAPLRLLPGHCPQRRRLANPAAALGRLPALRPARDVRAPSRRVALPGATGDPARRRRGPGREPVDRPQRLVRHRRRPGATRARARVRARHPQPPRLGRREPRRSGRAEAVRPRRGAVPAGHAPCRPRPAADALAGGGRLRRRLLRHRPPLPDRRSRRALGRHDRLRRRHVPHRRLRPRRAPAQPGRPRRPLRLLPVPAARDLRLAPDHGLAALEPVAR